MNGTAPYLWHANIASGDGWILQATIHYLRWYWPRSMSHYGVIGGQWDKCIGPWTHFTKNCEFTILWAHQYWRGTVEKLTLQWRRNGRDGVLNYQPHNCVLNRLFSRSSKKTSKLRVTGLCAGNWPVTGEFPAQITSNAENASIFMTSSWACKVSLWRKSSWSAKLIFHQLILWGLWYLTHESIILTGNGQLISTEISF